MARTVQHGAFREQSPTPFAPSNAASKTCVGPVFSNGERRVAANRSKNLKRTLFPTADYYGYEFDEFLRALFKAIESCRLRVDLE